MRCDALGVAAIDVVPLVKKNAANHNAMNRRADQPILPGISVMENIETVVLVTKAGRAWGGGEINDPHLPT